MLLGYYSLHFIIPSLPPFSFFSILLVHIYFLKKEPGLFWTSLLTTLHKFYNCKWKRFLWSYNTEPSDNNAKLWTSTLVEMAKGKTVCKQNISYCLNCTRKVVFQGGYGVTFSNFYRGERLFTVYRCMTFFGIIEL